MIQIIIIVIVIAVVFFVLFASKKQLKNIVPPAGYTSINENGFTIKRTVFNPINAIYSISYNGTVLGSTTFMTTPVFKTGKMIIQYNIYKVWNGQYYIELTYMKQIEDFGLGKTINEKKFKPFEKILLDNSDVKKFLQSNNLAPETKTITLSYK